MSRIILHLDMDAFFAAIEERERPELRGKPIVVGADPKNGHGRGVVSTASYAARKFGIHSAMPISRAWRLCPAPKCAYLPVDGKLYGIVSERIMRVVRECVEKECTTPNPSSKRRGNESISSPVSLREIPRRGTRGEVRRGGSAVVEQFSIDEAYVDVSFCASYENAERLARTLKDEIKKRERLTCSIGIGPNKLIAKIASDFKKPDGLTVVRPDEVQNFLDPMAVRKLPGIGPKTEAELLRQGIRRVGELRRWCSAPPLTPPPRGGETNQFPLLFHPTGDLPQGDKEGIKGWLGTICAHAHGIDNSPVVEEHEAKSLGHEITFERDTRDQALLTRTLMELCDEVMEEARKEGARFRTITVRVRFADFKTHTSSHTLRAATDNDTLLKQEALKLLFPYFGKKRPIRLIGVRVSHLT